MFILSIGTSLFEVLPLWTTSPKIVRFFHPFVDSCIGTICHHNDFTGWVLLWENFISPRNNLFHTQKRFFSDKVQIPKWAPFAPNGTANQIAGNPGTTVVNIGHLTTWPENPGYRTQAWDKGIDTNIEVIVVSLTTCEAHHSPRAKPEACRELPRSLMRQQWPKLRYQFLFYHDETKFTVGDRTVALNIIARCSITQTTTGQSKVWWLHARKMVVVYIKRI